MTVPLAGPDQAERIAVLGVGEMRGLKLRRSDQVSTPLTAAASLMMRPQLGGHLDHDRAIGSDDPGDPAPGPVLLLVGPLP